MSRYFGSICALFAAALLFASCLNTDDGDTTLYDDTAITSFQIASALIEYTTTSSTGEDSTYEVTSTAVADIPFQIDHQKGLIYNPDSLPLGTDLTRLLCSWSTKNNGAVYIENLTRDSIKYLQTTDSTDFTSPRYVRVYSSNGLSYRSYCITVNAHKEYGDAFTWTQLYDDSDIAALGGMKAVSMDDEIYVFGYDNGSTAIYYTDDSDGNSWIRSSVTLGSTAYNNVVVKNDTLYVLDGSVLKMSTNGETFVDVVTNPELSRLVAAGTTELYAFSTSGDILVSTDGGLLWSTDAKDSGLEYLPTQDITSDYTAFSYSDSTDYVLLAGNRSVADYPNDSTAVVWRKIVEYESGSEDGQWVFMDDSDYSKYQLPRLSQLVVLNYGSNIIAFGGAGVGACSNTAFSQIYLSRDGGITWKSSSSYVFPDGFDKTATSFSATVDKSNNIWIMCGGTGQVWRGRLNSLGWGE